VKGHLERLPRLPRSLRDCAAICRRSIRPIPTRSPISRFPPSRRPRSCGLMAVDYRRGHDQT